MRTNDDAADRIVSTFTLASNSMETKIEALTAQLGNTSLISVEETLMKFRVSNHEALDELSRKLDDALSQESIKHVLRRYSQLAAQNEEKRQKISDSLAFPQIEERMNHIAQAHRATYEWVLQPKADSQDGWDDFVLWARSKDERKKIYWIYSKPGQYKFQHGAPTISKIGQEAGSLH